MTTTGDLTRQTQRHTEATTGWGEISGDCMRTCIASTLAIHAEAVPNFALFPSGSWGSALAVWCQLWGIEFVVYSSSADDASYWAQFEGVVVRPLTSRPGDQVLIANGPSPRGDWLHSVVWLGESVLWDPHPSRAGLAGEPTEFWSFVR